MEQHPVPQNIIDVEFKLFGSFTLKQFSKVIIGALGGVVIYFLPIIPFIIKVPLIIMVVGAGILTALIPNFGVWLSGFLKALFISPRYVWIKKENTPELLQTKKEKEITQHQNVSSTKNEDKIDISEIPIDKLFSSKARKEDYEAMESKYENNAVGNSNIDSMYSQEFNNTSRSRPVIPNQAAPVGIPKPLTIENYSEQIDQLKYELSRLNKDSQFKAKEQEILSKINDLYREVKILEGEPVQSLGSQAVQSTVSKGKTITVSDVDRTTKTVFGVVVDKNDKPISRAGVIFTDAEDNSEYRAVSSPDGRFATQEIPVGKYNITIEHPSYKFHTYQIDIKDLKLPAYKFRER